MKPTSVIAQVAFIAAAAAAVYSFVRAAEADQRRSSCTALCRFGPAYAGRDRRAPDFELPDLEGRKVRLSSFRGKTVFLNFWTKTCGPCLDEMPSIAELSRVANGRGDMVVVTLCTDETAAEARDTLKVTLGGEPPFLVLMDPDSTVVRDKFGTKLFPETWIIDPDGIIRARFDGARNWSSALAIEVGEMVRRPGGCPVEFFKGAPRGAFSGLCSTEDE